MIKKNLNNLDTFLRTLVSIILIFIVYKEKVSLLGGFLLYFIAFYLILTVVLKWCGFYYIFEISPLKNNLKRLTKSSYDSDLKKYKSKVNTNK